MKPEVPLSVRFSQRLLLFISLAVVVLLPCSIWAVVGPTADASLDEAAVLYSRVEELWRAKASGDMKKTASMMTPASRELLLAQSQLPVKGGISGPIITDFLVEMVTIGSDNNIAKAEISFAITIPGAPVRIPQKQTEIWEKTDSVWFYEALETAQQYFDIAVTDAVDAGVTSVVDRKKGGDPLAPDVSERFDRYRIAAFWVSKAAQFLDSGRDDEACQLLKDAIRIGAPLVWERLIIVERLVGTDLWQQIVPDAKEEALKLVAVLERFGKSAEAVKIIKQSLAKNVNDFQLLEKLGDVYSAVGETKKAISAYSKTTPATTWSDDAHRIQWKLGQAFFTAGMYRDAVNALALSTATDPMAETLLPVFSLLADALLANEDFEHALGVYRVVCAFAFARPVAILGSAWLADTSNDEIREGLLDAWPKLRRHIKRRGKGASSSYTIGVLAESLGQSKAARKAFQRTLSAESDHAGSVVHIYANDVPNSDAKELWKRLPSLKKMFNLGSEGAVRSLAESLSRSPARRRAADKTPTEMRHLFSDGNLSRVILVSSGLGRADLLVGQAGINCGDSATIALDVAESGSYFLSFNIKPFAVQSLFQPTMALLLSRSCL